MEMFHYLLDLMVLNMYQMGKLLDLYKYNLNIQTLHHDFICPGISTSGIILTPLALPYSTISFKSAYK